MSKARGPPPPIAKKPSFKELPVPPVAKPPSFSKNLPVPTIINKLSSSLTDELNRKLATHLTLPTVPKKDYSRNYSQPKTSNSRTSFERSKENEIITSELQNVFSKRNTGEDTFSAPKHVHGSTLTEVTKLVDHQRIVTDLDSTLEFSLTDNPFDGTQSRGDDIIPAPTFDDTPSDFMDDDLPMVLPPPDMSMFDDMSVAGSTEGGCNSDDEEFGAPDFPDSNEVTDFNLFIPPPPPEPLLYDSDEDSYSETNFDHEADSDEYNDGDENNYDNDESTKHDDLEENENFINNVQNFLDNVQSSGGSAEDVAEHDDDINDLLLPPPLMTDNEDIADVASSDSSNVEQNDEDSFCSENIKAPTAFSSLQNETPVAFSSLQNETPVAFSSLQEPPVENVTNENRSVPTYTGKLAKNPLLVNSLNNVLKKQISNAESPTKMLEVRYSDHNDSDNPNNEELSVTPEDSASAVENPASAVEKGSSFMFQSYDEVPAESRLNDNKAEGSMYNDSDDAQTPIYENIKSPKLVSSLESSGKKSSIKERKSPIIAKEEQSLVPRPSSRATEINSISDASKENQPSSSQANILNINVSFENTSNKPVKSPSSVTATNNPLLANNLNNILKKQINNAGAPVKISELRKFSRSEKESNAKEQLVVTSGRSTPAVDDSGFSTARSQDGSDNGKNHARKKHSEEMMFTTMPAADTGSSPANVSPQLSQISRTRTFSSTSDDSSTLSDDEGPKLNLRHMLLQHMKNVDTDSDDTIDFTNETNLRMDVAVEDDHYGSDTETRLNEVDVVDWRVQDVCEWLELIGFSYLKPAFAKKLVTGKVLTNPDMNILDQIKFENPEDREIIQSEISALQMTNDEEMEMAILDALDKANNANSHNSRNAKFATMNRTPPTKRSNIPMKTPPNITLDETTSIDLNTSNDYQNDADNTSINSRNSTTSRNSRTSRTSRNSTASKNSTRNSKNLEDLKKRLGNDVYDPSEEEWKANETNDSTEQSKMKKKTKKKGFFSSLRKKKVKKEDTTAVDDNVQAITQSNPKGMVTIGYSPPNGGNEMEIKLLISMNTTSRDVCSLCLDHLGLNEDVKCYYMMAVSKKNKKAQNMELSPTDSPLMVQCKWNDDENNRFELKNRVDGQIIINNEDIQQEEMITYKLAISAETTAKDVVPVVLRIFDEKEEIKYFWLAEGENETRVADSTLLLGLPLNGQKFNVFKLVNTSPHYLKQRKMSYNDAKKVEDKVILLEKQVDKLSTLNEEYRRSEEHLAKENDKLSMEVKKQEDEVQHKSNDVKVLQEQVTALTQKLRLSTSLSEGPFKEENDKLKQKVAQLQYNLKSMEQSMKTLKDSKSSIEKEYEETLNKCKKMENLTEDLKDQLELLREEKRSKTTDNTEQMNRLYNENKEYLKSMRSLEDKLSETEQRLAEVQIGHDVESTEELAELRNRIDSLDSAVLAKDTRILELEFKMQQKERELKDTLDQWEDESRKSRKEIEMRENAENRYEDLSMKMDNIRLQLSEKEKQIQNFKSQSSKLEKKLNKQKYVLDNERNQKHQEAQEVDKRHQDELNILLEKVQNADKLSAENDLSMKQLAFDLSKEKEDLVQLNSDLEKKFVAKDIIIDRLESKIAKADLNLSSKLQEQGEVLLSKDEKLHRAEVEIAKLESEHASKLREMANTIRLKESLITKLEARFKKLEMSSADNVKKFEKYISEKDRLLQQVTSDHDQAFKDLRGRTRELEEMLKEKDKKVRDANRQYGEVKANADARLKKREKEYKRQKFLLEKVLKLVNDKAPSLLRQLHESLDCENQSLDNMKTSATSPRDGVIHDEWC